MRLYLIAVLSLVLAACAEAQPEKPPMDEARYQQGLDAYERRDRDEAIERLRPLAEAGYPKAQEALARVYFMLVPVDRKAAFALLYPLAERGDAEAQNILGDFLSIDYCSIGWSPEKCLEAADWLAKSAEQGNKYAVYYLIRVTTDSHFPREKRDWKKLYFYEYYQRLQEGSRYVDVWDTLGYLRKWITPEEAAEAERAAQAWQPKPHSL